LVYNGQKKKRLILTINRKGGDITVWLLEEKRLLYFLQHDQQNNPLFQRLWFFFIGNLKDALCHVAKQLLGIQNDTLKGRIN